MDRVIWKSRVPRFHLSGSSGYRFAETERVGSEGYLLAQELLCSFWRRVVFGWLDRVVNLIGFGRIEWLIRVLSIECHRLVLFVSP